MLRALTVVPWACTGIQYTEESAYQAMVNFFNDPHPSKFLCSACDSELTKVSASARPCWCCGQARDTPPPPRPGKPRPVRHVRRQAV